MSRERGEGNNVELSVPRMIHEEAMVLDDDVIGTEHILLAVAQFPESKVVQILDKKGVRHASIQVCARFLKRDGRLTDSIKGAVANAYEFAMSKGRFRIEVDDWAVGAISEKNSSASKVLRRLGVNPQEIVEELSA